MLVTIILQTVDQGECTMESMIDGEEDIYIKIKVGDEHTVVKIDELRLALRKLSAK